MGARKLFISQTIVDRNIARGSSEFQEFIKGQMAVAGMDLNAPYDMVHQLEQRRYVVTQQYEGEDEEVSTAKHVASDDIAGRRDIHGSR